MKELKTYPGGFPTVWNDLTILQEAYKEALASLAFSLVPTTTKVAVLTGVNTRSITNQNDTITLNYSNGFLFYNGEIIAFDGCSLSAPNTHLFWWEVTEENYNIPGSIKVKQGGSETKYFYVQKKLVLTHGEQLPQGAIEHNSLLRNIDYYIRNRLFLASPTVDVVIDSNDIGGSYKLYIRQRGAYLTIVGSIHSGAYQAGTVVVNRQDIVPTLAVHSFNPNTKIIADDNTVFSITKNSPLQIVLYNTIPYTTYGRVFTFNNVIEF
ncbi:MAG: hypothetical protein SNJ71_00190 [Bacteroidales bacterium]